MRRIEILSFALALALAPVAARAGVLRICADPNNLPFSNRAGQGFEDMLARLAARDLQDSLQFAYAVQNQRFIKRTLGAGKCDALMGVPAGLNEVDTTHPYYVSTYVFVSRESENLGIHSLSDPRLRKLRIGVHLIGDDSTPPALALGKEGIVDNVTGFMIEGNYASPNPSARPIEAVATKAIDVAAVWGPLGGYFARHSQIPLAVTRLNDTARFAPLQFTFPIAMGVRKGNAVLRRQLDGFIAKEQPLIRKILEEYGVPLEETQGGSHG